jgi:hypothetical protein
MDDRLYKLYGTIEWCMDSSDDGKEVSARWFSEVGGYTPEEFEHVLTAYRENQAFPSPMVHIHQHELNVLLAKANPLAFPPAELNPHLPTT